MFHQAKRHALDAFDQVAVLKKLLEYTLDQYKDGSRGGTVMSAFVTTLSDTDISVLAKFYGSQDGLQTLDQ